MADDAAEDPPQAKTPIAISSSQILRVVTALPHQDEHLYVTGKSKSVISLFLDVNDNKTEFMMFFFI